MPGVILATGGFDHTIRFWQAPSGLPQRTVQFQESQINKLSIGPRKQLILAAGNPYVRCFDVQSGSSQPITLEGHTNNVVDAGFHREERWVYTASEDGTVRIWDLRSHRSQRDFSNEVPVTTACLHPNQGEIVFGDQNGRVRVWDLSMNKCSQTLVPEARRPIRSISISSDGSMIAVANNKGLVYHWKPLEKTEVSLNMGREAEHSWQAHDRYVLKCLFSPDCRSLATCSADSSIKIWAVDEDGEGFTLHKTLEGHTEWVWDCAFSTDSAYLVSGSSDHVARLWEVATGETVRQYTGHHKAIVTVALNDSQM